jgi:hypothetical protein
MVGNGGFVSVYTSGRDVYILLPKDNAIKPTLNTVYMPLFLGDTSPFYGEVFLCKKT